MDKICDSLSMICEWLPVYSESFMKLSWQWLYSYKQNIHLEFHLSLTAQFKVMKFIIKTPSTVCCSFYISFGQRWHSAFHPFGVDEYVSCN